jgi:hypothetical protein
MLVFPHVAVVQEDINVLVLLMTLSPDDRDRELYYIFKTTKK